MSVPPSIERQARACPAKVKLWPPRSCALGCQGPVSVCPSVRRPSPLPLRRAPRPAWKQHTPVSGDASSCVMAPVKPLFWFACSFLSRVIEGDGPENNTHGAKKRVREERKPREGLETDAGHCSAPTLSHQPSGYLDST